MKRSALLAWATAMTCLGAGSTALWVVTNGLSSFTTESWRRADVQAHPRSVPDVVLQDQTGREMSLSQRCNQLWVIDFVYTRCTTLCRAQGAISSQLARRMSEQSRPAQVLSISFDPNHDTPAALSQFKRAMESSNTSWQLARPTHDDGKKALLQAFGVVVIPDGDGGFDHNAALHIVDRCKLVRVLDVEDIDGAVALVRELNAAQGH